MSQAMISVPCKRGFDVKMNDVLLSYIRDTYGEDQSTSHTLAVADFNNMRSKMLNKLFDKHESSINIITRYYDQFVALEGKIPIEENGVRIDFKWEDAFSKESVFGKKTTLKIASGGFEKLCVLFNIAALYSQVAETQNLSDDSGLKNAAKYFQQAAGIFSYLKSAISIIVQRETTSDLNVDTLSTLCALMIAQAQELIYIKAARDQMKEGNIARIVQQASDLYADALKLMQLNSVKSIWPKEWIPLVAGKQASYHAVAEYYQAKSCGANHAFGEQIARLKKASELMKTASTRAGQKFSFRSEQERIKKDLETIEKENNMIYHDTIPDVASLSIIFKAVLARELPLENPIDKDFKDLFNKIVPLALHSAMLMFQNKQRSMINAEVFRLKEATNTLGGILSSLNLPAALEDNKDDDVPNSLLEKAAALKSKGGIDKIDEMINNLPEVMRRNDEILNEATRMLDEEEDSDKKLKEQFKDRWNRTPSSKLTESWRGESMKFANILQQARGSDDVIRKTYQEYSPKIRILSQNEPTIKESIPKSKGNENASDSSQNIKQEIRKLYNDVESMKVTRSSLIDQLSNNEENSIGNTFMRALTEDGSVNQEHLADEHLNQMLVPFREQVRKSLDMQDQLLSQIQEKCSHMRGGDDSSQSRSSVISSLMLAVDKFTELIGNLEEGLKFYGDLTDILLKFQNKVKDFCFARKTEKDELMKDLQTAIVREKTDMTSTANFQATSPGTDISQQASAPNSAPQRPSATYLQGASTQVVPSPTSSQQPAPSSNPQPGMPYPPSPYNMPQPYTAGAPYGYPQYGYQGPPLYGQQVPHGQQPLAPGQQPQLQYPPQYPPQQGQVPQYPSGYNYQTYPGYNPYYPR